MLKLSAVICFADWYQPFNNARAIKQNFLEQE